MTETSPANQAAIFRTVKPACVRLSEDALKLLSGSSNPSNVVSSAENLLEVLRVVLRNEPNIDERLVNYIFFPLSHLFKEKDKFPNRAVELGLECLLLLLQTGWRSIQDAKLGLQLLIFLTFLADKEQSPGANAPVSSEDLKRIALKCISQLFQSLRDCQACKDALAATSNLPAVGHAVTVLLDTLKGQAPRDIQVSAIQALYIFCTELATFELLGNFLPGVFSSFSHVLVPTSKERRPYQVLEKGLLILKFMTGALLSDASTVATEPNQPGGKRPEKGLAAEKSAWLKATAAQTKLVFANVIKLRDHERPSVRSALSQLCWVVLESCQTSLSESVPLMLETSIYLLSKDPEAEGSLRFQRLLSESDLIRESARSFTYDASSSLPRILASNDEEAKSRQTQQISTVLNLLHESGSPTTLIDETLQRSILECLSSLLETKETTSQPHQPDFLFNSSNLTLQNAQDQTDLISTLNVNSKAEQSLGELNTLVRALSQGANALTLARDSLTKIYDNESKFSNLWFCFNILQNRAQQTQDIDLYLETDSVADEETAVRNELYAVAVTHLSLSDQAQDSDWRIQALALEIIAFQAINQKQEFRLELVDSLYMVVHQLGSPVQALRSLATKCLNIMATSCGYSDAKDLIVSNVDYLVNAVGMKLNAMDISPQTPQVLLMMIKLSGPMLLPYLEDLVDGIFEALECFHGYSILVEQLFSVLNGAVEEGIKTSPFLDRPAEHSSHVKETPRLQNMQELIDRMSQRQLKQSTTNQNEIPLDQQKLPLNTPHKPWKELRKKQEEDSKTLEELPEDESDNDSDKSDQAEAPPEDKGPTLAKTYKMLQTISTQTQHHLPSSSSAVRISLLSLLSKALPFLAQHDDTFLPLINTLWPVLVPRLDDKEAFVVAGVLNVMSAMCAGAGDFMASRVESLWPRIRKVHARCAETNTSQRRLASNKAISQPSDASNTLSLTSSLIIPSSSTHSGDLVRSGVASRPSDDRMNARSENAYVSTSARTIRDALTNFLVHLLSHVRVSEEMYHEILHDMLFDELIRGERRDVRDALDVLNADAVWLVLKKHAQSQQRSSSTYGGKQVLGYDVPLDVAGGPSFIRA